MTWVKRILLVLVVGFFLFYLIQQPEGAAAAVRTVFSCRRHGVPVHREILHLAGQG